MKKIVKWFSSMPFAIALLVLLVAACALSSTVSQGLTYDQYAAQYGERTAGLILALRLDDAFHSWWFIGLSAVLCLNLLCCNLLRLPALLRRVRAFTDPDRAAGGKDAVRARGTGDPRRVFTALRMPGPKEGRTAGGQEMLFAAGNRAGLWGAWICHLGILLLILGFALGQATMKQYTVYALPGQTKDLGDTGLTVTVDDFEVLRTENGSAKQYTAALTVSDPAAGTRESGTASVNAPANLYGYKFFQNSTGWGADVRVLKNGAELQQEALCAGEFFPVKDKPELVIFFQAFYPDYVPQAGSASEELNNPAYLYQVYYQGQILGMNVLLSGEELTIDEYTVLFGNPRPYTLLAVKRDRFTWLVLLGGLVTLAGLLLAFGLQPRVVRAVREGTEWTLEGTSRKGGVIFRESFLQAASAAGFEPCTGTDGDPGTETTEGENG